MTNEVIIFVGDDNYINHIKSIAVNCRLQGKYTGDFAVICPVGSSAASEFRQRGFHVLEVNAKGFLQKFYVFDEFFTQWSKCLYLDCDVIVQDNLQRLFELTSTVNTWEVLCDTEDGKIIEMFHNDTNKEAHAETYREMERLFTHVNTHQTFNTAFILFNPLGVNTYHHNLVESTIPELLFRTQEIIHEINDPENGGSDQQPINLFMWYNIKKIPQKLVTFWGCDEPQNRIYSEWRNWVGDEVPVALHYSRWYGQWIEKTPNMDAYMNHRLGKPCNDIYKENLALFDTIFKIKEA